MTDPAPSPYAASGIILLPSDRFFVRTVPLAAGVGVAAQVEIALENLAPFPPAQLYYGYVAASVGDQALVFAAYRRRFSAEEMAAWEAAGAVVPGFLALLGDTSPAPIIRLLVEQRTITALAWDGAHSLPVAVLARETESIADAAPRTALLDEIRARTGLIEATVQVTEAVREHTVRLGRGELETADVRDKDFLASRRAQRRRDVRLWRIFAATLGGLAAMLVLEAALFAGGIWRQRLQAAAQAQVPAVQQIEAAQALSTRIGEMAQRRLMPFEMLALINQGRSASIQFMRTTTTGLHAMEVEAQAANAPDVGQYEAALRATPGFTGIEIRDLRSREGLTTFTLAVAFKPELLPKEEGP